MRRHLVSCALAIGGLQLVASCSSEPGGDAGNNADTTAVDRNGPVRAILQITVEHDPKGQSAYAVICEDSATQLQGNATGIDAEAACAALTEADVQDRLLNGPPSDDSCGEGDSSTAKAYGTGTINDASFDFAVDRSDSCGVSDWDQLLSDILAPAKI